MRNRKYTAPAILLRPPFPLVWRGLLSLAGLVICFLSTLPESRMGFFTIAAAADTKVIRYLPIGDSYTIGHGVAEHDRYPNVVAELLKSKGFPIELVDNPARSGWTSAMAAETELPVAKRAKPDLVTLLIGTNDFVQDVSPSRYREQVRALMDDLQASLAPGGTFVVISVPDFSPTPGARRFGEPKQISEGLSALNGVLRDEAGKRNLPFVDIFPLSAKLSVERAMLIDDQVHPSAAQYREWASVIAPAIEAALKKQK